MNKKILILNRTRIPVIFWALIGFFLVIVSQICIPAVTELFRGSLLFLLPFIIFSLLGVALIVFTIKGEAKGWRKKFLILTGVSAAGFFVGVFLHNAFYALGVITVDIVVLKYLMDALGVMFLITVDIVVLKYLMDALGVMFFILAVIGCPLGFLVGAVGSIVLFLKERKKNRERG
jgi:hypothetical protein